MVEAVVGLLAGKLNWRGDSVGDASLMRMLGRRTISGRVVSGLLFSLRRVLFALESEGLDEWISS